MLKILGIILGFIIMVLSVIGLIVEDKPVLETPDDLYGPEEMIKWEDEGPQALPELHAGIGAGYSQDAGSEIADDGTGYAEDVIISDGTDSLGLDVIVSDGMDSLGLDVIISDGTDSLGPDVIISDGTDSLAETVPQVTFETGMDLEPLSAGLGAEASTYDLIKEAEEEGEANVITFGDGYSMQIPEVMTLADGGDEDDYEIMGFSVDQEPAFSIRCITPDHTLTLKDLQEICMDLYGGSELVKGSDLTYLTAFDADNLTELCIFGSDYSDQIYIIGFTGLDGQQPAGWYFDTISH